nr:uncharacterized protein LOC112489909 isoform X3 [Ziziphus jujuba var. spinosa]
MMPYQEQFAWVIWRLWNRVNAHVHGNTLTSDKSILDGVIMLQTEYKEANSLSLTHAMPASKISWTPPIGNRLKINVDAATQVSSGRMGTGVVVRNCRGELLGALAKIAGMLFVQN